MASRFRILALAVAVLAGSTQPQAQTIQYRGMLTYPYPGWFYSPQESSEDQLLFRLYANEVGLARNIFVLSCRRGRSAVLEVIPPKSVVTTVLKTASSDMKPTAVRFQGGENFRATGTVLQKSGEHDNIAAFVTLDSHAQLATFLGMLEREMVFVHWTAARVDYVLWSNRVYIEQFEEKFLAQGRQRYQEIKRNEVLERCKPLWPSSTG